MEREAFDGSGYLMSHGFDVESELTFASAVAFELEHVTATLGRSRDHAVTSTRHERQRALHQVAELMCQFGDVSVGEALSRKVAVTGGTDVPQSMRSTTAPCSGQHPCAKVAQLGPSHRLARGRTAGDRRYFPVGAVRTFSTDM